MKKNKKGIVTQIWNDQIKNSKKRNHSPPAYKREWLEDFILNHKLFNNLFNEWVKSKYDTNLKPSIDRKNNDIGYTKKNIRLMTWRENNDKGRISNRKKVYQYTLENKLINTFSHAKEAAIQTKTHFSNIGRCCNGFGKTANGFIWKYGEDGIR